MATGKALDGKPYAGNPHVRFDEGEVAPCTSEASLRRVHCRRQPEGRASVCAATPRRGSLLYVVKNIALQVAIASLSLCAAAGTKVWVGESGGLWGEASNWDPSGVPSYTDVVVFRPAGEMIVENKTVSTCNGMRFESGSVLLYSSANRIYLNTGTNDIYVAPGVTACVSNGVVSKGSDPRATPRKTGGGTLVITASGLGEIWGNDNGKISAFDFAEGVTELRCAGTIQLVCPITIRSGATVKSPRDYAFHASQTPITIEEDGVLDLDGAGTVYMAGLNGAGVVTNASTISNVKLVGGPHLFSGKIYPKPSSSQAVFSIAPRAESTATEDEWKQYICSSDAFAKVQFKFPTSATGGCPLGFAAGIGTFWIYDMQGNDKTHLVLEDEDGLPVTVNTSYSNLLKLRLKGSGTLRNSYGGDSSYGSTVDLSLFTGTFVQASGNFTLGNGTAANWPVLNPAMRIENVGAGSFSFKPSSDGTVIAGEIAGTGTYLFYGKATLQAFNPVGSWVQLRADSDLTISGGYAQIASWGIYMYENSKLSVTNGAYVGGLDRLPDSYKSALRHPYGAPFQKGQAVNGSLDVSAGGVLDTQGSVPHVTLVHDGGVLRISGNPEATGTAASPGVWTFDGGVLEANNIVVAYNLYMTPESDGVKVVVGERGMTLNLDTQIFTWHGSYNQFHLRKPFYGADGGDGGVVRIGAGILTSYAPHSFSGPFASLDGRILIPNKSAVTTATTPLFGSGDFVLGNSRIDFDGGISSAFTTRIGTGGRFVYSGASTFRVRESAARPVQTIQLGELARGGKGAAMFFLDQTANAEYNDGGANLTTTVAPATDADGRVKAPVFAVACPQNYSGGHIRFASYSADVGLKAFDGETEGVGGGASKAAKVTTAKATVAENASVAALRVDGISSVYSYPDGGDAQLWISSGATLTVGDGVNPGVVILNNNRSGWCPATIRGAGTLDFGANEGLVAYNETCNGFNAAIYCRIAGSGGVSIVKPITVNPSANVTDLSRASVELYGTHTWTGGTLVNGARVDPKNPLALSSGTVTLGSGQLAGGELAMTVSGLEIANAVKASGWGISERGAVNFEADGTLSGPFELCGSARVHAVNGVRGELSGVVSGGELCVHGSWYDGIPETNGVIVLSNQANSYTGGTYVTRTTLALKGSGAAGVGAITLDGGTLRIENDEARTVANEIRGVGRVQLASRDAVGFASLASQDGVGFTLDVDARVATVESLAGFSAITTARTAQTHLVVSDGDIDFDGELPENVTLHAYAYERPGFMLIMK